MAVPCTCRLTSTPGEYPALYDRTSCPTHGPTAPRYYVDHGTIHDRVTGTHVESEAAAARLNAIEADRDQWQRRAAQHGCHVTDGDAECG